MNNAFHSPIVDTLFAIGLIAAGVLMLIYRDKIGEITGYWTGTGGYVDKPTPGWMLIPFALALIVAGIMTLVHSW
jgi:hypothetical protein